MPHSTQFYRLSCGNLQQSLYPASGDVWSLFSALEASTATFMFHLLAWLVIVRIQQYSTAVFLNALRTKVALRQFFLESEVYTLHNPTVCLCLSCVLALWLVVSTSQIWTRLLFFCLSHVTQLNFEVVTFQLLQCQCTKARGQDNRLFLLHAAVMVLKGYMSHWMKELSLVPE